MESTTKTPQSNHPGVAPDEVVLKFDSPEAVGTISLRRHTYGAEILVDGIEIGLVDLFHRSARGNEASPSLLQRGSVGLHCMRTDDGGDDYRLRLYHRCEVSRAEETAGRILLRTVAVNEDDDDNILPLSGRRHLDTDEQPWKP